MPKILKVHILKVGDSISADGVEKFHTAADLDEIASTYNAAIHEAPVILGHSSDPDWSKTLSRNDKFPAYGWVDRMYREGNDLYADLDASEELEEFINKKRYKKRSLGYYGPNSKHNPVKGKKYARHIAFLGLSPPAIKGLEDITLAENNKMAIDVETKELLDKNAEQWLAFILKDDGNIVRDTIVAFDPKPTSENNYLYDVEERKWEGAFINDSEERFLFEIVQQDSGESGEPEFIVSVKADIGEQDAEAEEAIAEEDQQVLESAKTPNTPAEDEAEANLEDQSTDVNLSEENKMGTLLKEKTTTEKEYAGDKPVDEAPATPEEKVENTELEEDGEMIQTEHKEYGEKEKMEYMKYCQYKEGKGEKPVSEEEFMEMRYGTYGEKEEAASEEPVAEEEMGEGCLGEDCPGKEENTETIEETEMEENNVEAMKEELNMLRAKVKAQEEEEMKSREEEMVKFSEGLYEDSKILESQFKKEDLTSFLTSLLHMDNEHMVYGEGDAQTTVLETVKSLLSNLPEQVTYSEGATMVKSNKTAVKFDPRYSEGSQKRRAKILAIMDERGIDRKDMRKYMEINRELTQKEGHYE